MAAFGHKKCRSEVEVVEKSTFDVHAHGKLTRAGKISGVSAETLVSTDANGNLRASNTLNANLRFFKLHLDREMTTIYPIKIPASGWSTSAPYTQVVTVDGLVPGDAPIVDLNMGAATVDNAADMEEAFAKIGRIVAETGKITLYCYTEAPTIDVPIRLKVAR